MTRPISASPRRTDRELLLDGNDVGLVRGDELDGFADLVFGEDLKRAV